MNIDQFCRKDVERETQVNDAILVFNNILHLLKTNKMEKWTTNI